MTWAETLAQRARRGDGILRHARTVWHWILSFRLPVIRPLHALLYAEWSMRGTYVPLLLKILYREPLLRYRCARVGRRLRLSGNLPMIIGDGTIEIGDDFTLDAENTWQVGFKISTDARLVIGDRVFIGDHVGISVAKSVTIGDDTLIAGRTFIFDNISHPLSPARRLRGDSFTLDESSPIVIGRNVWVGTSAFIMRGVTIGDNSVVAAGAVVTESVPPNTLVAGAPARVIRSIAD